MADYLADVERMEEVVKKLEKERDVHHKFAMDANEILRDLWNSGALDKQPIVKRRVAELYAIPMSTRTI